MPEKPSGTVTFLFTDIEGSTKLAREHSDQFETLRQRHHSILHSAIETHDGYVFQIIGDAFCAAFPTAGEALQAAGRAQSDLYNENWGTLPIKVRMGIHTGKALLQENGEYTGYLTMSRVQRVMSAGSGGQTLLSQAAQELVRDELPGNLFLDDLGEHRLKDLIRPEHIYQLNVSGLPSHFPPIKTLDNYRHNLPVQMTSFVGRETEIAEVKQALSEHHLVTLTGPGGSGKTRLALQVAADLIDQFNDGVWFVDLAPLSDPSFVSQAIATALNVSEEGATSLMDLITQFVRRRELLLVLDNCEHLVEACAYTADLLLQAAPRLKLITTSREGLGIAGEKTFSVPSLSFAATSHPSLSTLTQYDATRLFIDRALLVQPHFEVNNENAPAVAQICYRLDGIPLAIELAAARIKAMTPQQIATRLDDSFRLLTGGSRTALPRQQTLRAMMDWSWDLLSDDERVLLRRVSVFAGGWTLEAAEGVCAGEGILEADILDLLTQLVSKSLVIWHDQPEEPRYQLLETIRQYAHTKLSEANEPNGETRLDQRHAEYFTGFAELAKSSIYSPAQAVWLKRLEAEHDNLRTALEWSISLGAHLALRIVTALGDYMFWRSNYTEGIQWGERALSTEPDAPLELRGYALAWTALCADQIGRIDKAIQYGKDALDLARQSQDKALLALALFISGSTAIEGGNSSYALACFEEALPLAQETQSPAVLPGVLAYIGMMVASSGEYAQAKHYFDESIKAVYRLNASFWEPMCFWFSGHIAFMSNDMDKARDDLRLGMQSAQKHNVNMIFAHIEEMFGRVQILDLDYSGARSSLSHSFSMLQDMGLAPCLAHGLEGWARLAMAQGDVNRAARILGGISAHMKALGMNMIPLEQAMYDQTQAVVLQQLGADGFEQELAAGRKLDLQSTINLAIN